MLDAGCWSLVSGCWPLVAGLWLIVSGRLTLNNDHWYLSTGFQSLVMLKRFLGDKTITLYN
jgi:hypothetical protein